MPFKIVQTVEKNRPLLTAVPHEWEENGKLFWPKKHEKLRRMENSKPESNWKQINCILKRSNLSSFMQAEFEIDNMSNASDTETDNDKSHVVTRNRTILRNTSNIQQNFNDIARECCEDQEVQPQIVNNSLIIKSADVQHSSNEEIILMNTTSVPLPPVFINSDIPFPTSQNHTISMAESRNQESSIHNISQNFNEFTEQHTDISNIDLRSPVFMTEDNIEPQDTTVTNVISIDDAMTLVLQKLDDMKQDINKLFENQKKILFKLTETNTQFEEFIKTTCKQTKPENTSVIKPISNLKELQDLELLLADTDFKARLKNKIEIFCSKGKNRGINNAYSLIDILFQRSFLCQCSWAGGSKTGSSKICLKSFTSVFDLFFSVLHESDTEFKKPDCEKFIKTVLKNSRQRLASKQSRMSTTRCRKQLKKTVPTSPTCLFGDSLSDNPRKKPATKGKENPTLASGEKLFFNELPVPPHPQEPKTDDLISLLIRISLLISP